MRGKIAQGLLAASLLWGSFACAYAQEGSLPSFYDLRLSVPEDRNSGYDPRRARINPIRNQGIFGTCWAFSAIASVESNLYTQMQEAGIPYSVQEGTVDLSEWYLAWVSMAPPIGVEEDYVNHTAPRDDSRFYRPYAPKVYDVGGFSAFYLETMLANGTGLDWEESKGVRNIVAPSVYKEPVLQLKNIYFAKAAPPDIPAIKEMLMKYGALSFALDATPLTHESYETAFYSPRRVPANMP